MAKKRESPTPTVTPEELARNGDVFGVLRFFREHPIARDIQSRIALLRSAMAAAADQDFDDAVKAVYRLMIEFVSELLILSQTFALRRVDQLAQRAGNSYDGEVGKALDTLLPQVEKLHHHLIALTRAYATTSHTQRLARPAAAAGAQDRATVLKLVRETDDIASHTEVRCG
jgi:hypothetical protein